MYAAGRFASPTVAAAKGTFQDLERDAWCVSQPKASDSGTRPCVVKYSGPQHVQDTCASRGDLFDEQVPEHLQELRETS